MEYSLSANLDQAMSKKKEKRGKKKERGKKKKKTPRKKNIGPTVLWT